MLAVVVCSFSSWSPCVSGRGALCLALCCHKLIFLRNCDGQILIGRIIVVLALVVVLAIFIIIVQGGTWWRLGLVVLLFLATRCFHVGSVRGRVRSGGLDSFFSQILSYSKTLFLRRFKAVPGERWR